MTLRFGEVGLIRMQFHPATGAKVRTGDDDFVASYIRVLKLTVLAKADIVHSLAPLPERDREPLLLLLCRALCRRMTGT